MLFSFSFNGIKKDYIICESGKRRSAFAPIKRNLLTVLGMPGAYLESTDTEVRTIEQPIIINGKDRFDVRKLEEDLSSWIYTAEPAELIFDDEPDRVYYAVIDGSLDIEDIARFGKGTITFICPDPYKYGPEKTIAFADTTSFQVDGTVETLPVVKTTILQDTTFIAVANGDKLNMIGMPANVDQQPSIRDERLLWKDMGSIIEWADTTSVEGGVIAGTMKTSGYAFYTDTYGNITTGWHGPAKKISIGSALQDFQVDALIQQIGSSGQVGSVEIALLDASNNVVGKMLMAKRAAKSMANWARFRAGSEANGYDITNYRGANDWTWANFSGLLRISRVGNVWTAYVCQIDSNGKQTARYSTKWTDSINISPNAITQVKVQLWQAGTIPVTSQNIWDLKVFKINSLTDTQVPIIASAGDVIEFDHQADIIRKNGEDMTKEKAFIGDYFSLEPGLNTIVVEPAEAIDSTEVRWKPKWR